MRRMRASLFPVVLCIAILLVSGCIDNSGLTSNNSSPTQLPTTPSPTLYPAFHHPPAIFLYTLESAINVLGEPLLIPMELPPGYVYLGGSATSDAVSLGMRKDTDNIRYVQVSPPQPIGGTLTGVSVPVTFNGTEGQCTTEGDKRQLFWTDGTHDFYLIGSLSCDEFIRMAASLGPLTKETLEKVPWKDLEPATPLPQSEVLNLVFSRDWLDTHDTNPDPQIFEITMTVEDYNASFVPDSNDPDLLRHAAVRDEKPVALLNMPKDMFERFNDDPSLVKIHFPDSFFRFYDSMDALYEDLESRAESSSTAGSPTRTPPSVIVTTPRIY